MNSFSTIEHNEDPNRNYRRAFRLTYEDRLEALQQEKQAFKRGKKIWVNDGDTIYIDHESFRIGDMTDEEMRFVALREAERAVERAIRERQEAEKVERQRKGWAQ